MTGWLIAGAVAVITTAFGVLWAALKAGARANVRAAQSDAYRKTRERIDHAGKDTSTASDDDVAQRLHDYAGQ